MYSFYLEENYNYCDNYHRWYFTLKQIFFQYYSERETLETLEKI